MTGKAIEVVKCERAMIVKIEQKPGVTVFIGYSGIPTHFTDVRSTHHFPSFLVYT